jgi:hypothetical protein
MCALKCYDLDSARNMLEAIPLRNGFDSQGTPETDLQVLWLMYWCELIDCEGDASSELLHPCLKGMILSV